MWFLLLSVKQNIPCLCVRVCVGGGVRLSPVGKWSTAGLTVSAAPKPKRFPKHGAAVQINHVRKKIPAAGLSNSSNLWEGNCSLRTVNK